MLINRNSIKAIIENIDIFIIFIDFNNSFIKILMHIDTADENMVISSWKKTAFFTLFSEPFKNASSALLIKISSPP